MKKIELSEVKHQVKIGNVCPDLQPNITESCIFLSEGIPVGMYVRELPEKAKKYASIADVEFVSSRVPKSTMNRTSGETGDTERVQQYSTIIGNVQPRPHMGRPEPRVSSVHQVKTARRFIKSMMLLEREATNIIKNEIPDVYKEHLEAIRNHVPLRWKFTNHFTSSISNRNIAASYHRDTGNLRGTVNVIISKRKMSTGGHLSIPDYNAVIEQCDNSMIVYPAWRNVHGVTPINPTYDGGYRNSLVFYSLKAFKNH